MVVAEEHGFIRFHDEATVRRPRGHSKDSPPPLCKYFTWIDQEVREHVQEDQHRDDMWRQHLFNEALAREEKRERREKEKKERKKREDEKKRKEKEARKEERARKLARARDAQVEDEARDKKGKGPRTTQ
ncbi:hypothetical protein ZWY2020_037920 [Hordeum vulgare]|nr:hypothetical protein ZWY2020_037920 [Hordeum vulgare]